RTKIGGSRITEEWLDSLGDTECRWYFRSLKNRFTLPELKRLVRALRIYDPFITECGGYHFSTLEALCLLIYQFHTADNLYSIQTRFCRSLTSLSFVINELATELELRWTYLLDFN
ncbi:hypothetical protein OF83DRAFT_1030150, partial [Amylostereum chailletii]